MTLHVPFEEFPSTLLRLFNHNVAFVEQRARGIVVTAASKDGIQTIAAAATMSLADAKKALENGGLQISSGRWSLEVEPDLEPIELTNAYIAAVAYVSQEGRPGVWVDAFIGQPTQVNVLQSIYEEFRKTGEVGSASFEEFVRLAKPNVAIVSPNEISRYLESKESLN